MQLSTDRTFTFDADIDTVREQLDQTDRYPEWWPWLSGFEARRLAPGERWRCAVRSPLRTTLRFEIAIETAEHASITAELMGDVSGTARIALEPIDAHTTQVRFVAAVHPRAMSVATLTRFAPRLARWAHDRIVDTGAEQFAAALPTPATTSAGRSVQESAHGNSHSRR